MSLFDRVCKILKPPVTIGRLHITTYASKNKTKITQGLCIMRKLTSNSHIIGYKVVLHLPLAVRRTGDK